jgi:long-chain alkane monooxygenase
VLFMASPVVGETDEEAQAKRARQVAFAEAHPELGLLHLSRHSGIDFAQFPLDEPIPDTAKTNGHQQMLAQAIGKTPREFLRKSLSTMEFVGSPDTVAAKMEEVMAEVGGDGFLFGPRTVNRRSIMEITEGLVPALQRRGLVRTAYDYPTFRENLLAY